MMRGRIGTITLGLLATTIAGCEIKHADDAANATAAANIVAPATPAPQPVASATPAAFSIDTLPLTTASLPPFPFFSTPEGLVAIVSDKDANVAFDGQWFMAGTQPRKEEGRIWHNHYSLTGDRPYSETEFHRNYENAIAALGGHKVSAGQWSPDILNAVGGLGAVDKFNRGASPNAGYRHESYVLRAPGKDYWIEVSTGSFPLHGYVVVLEKTGMKQSLGFLDASAMKSAIDATGRVALQVNFDVDKATLRPDAQPTMDEIGKLLAENAALKLSIEGHTDATGDAARNRELSAARARSVLGALVGLGVDPARLTSRGFGPDKPVADNASEEGRAKNRRVELVRR